MDPMWVGVDFGREESKSFVLEMWAQLIAKSFDDSVALTLMTGHRSSGKSLLSAQAVKSQHMRNMVDKISNRRPSAFV
jgi:hypothetical protein